MNGDPQNFTWSGFPRHRYAACGRDIELPKPFEVVPGGGWNDPLAIPLSYLTDPSTTARTPEGIDRHNRIEFAFPSQYRGVGMWEWQARAGGQRFVKPLSDAVRFLGSNQAKHDQGMGGDSWFQGVVDGRRVAMICSAVNWANPACEVEVMLGINEQRFQATLPPKAVGQLGRVIQLGAELFSDTAPLCGRKSPPRSTETKIVK